MAGAVGTAALSLSELLETKVVRERPVYSAATIASNLLHQPGHSTRVRTVSLALRWTYGPALGVAVALARRHLPGSTLVAGLTASLAVAAAELCLLPRVGAVLPWRRWPAVQRLTFGVHVVVWGLVTAAVHDSARGRSGRAA